MEVQHENETGREGGAPKSEKEAGAMISNQETEKAAMKKGGNAGSARELESPNEATTTRNQYEENTTKPIKLDGIFAIPATPPNKVGLITKSASSSRSSSLKKQRRGSRGKTNLNVTGTENGVPKSNTGTNSVGNDLMKQSQSMTSLQASNEEQQERRDVIQAKLHLERPYNSLKKNSHSNKMHRYSWGSGNSQCSSTSLHSSATLGLGSSGKDDLWAAIQTNYNYIMDTNLLDTCKEARCEIEGAATVLEKSSECSFKMLDETQRPEGLCEDPKELRRWLREMESKLETSPTITELTLFGNAELQRHLAVHSVLYHEIVSHARVVSSCIRAAEKEQQLQQQQQQQLQLQQQQQQQQLSSQQPASLTSNCSSESTSDSATKSSSLSSGFASDPVTTPTTAIGTTAAAPPPSGSHHPSKKGEGNLERLRDRYHLLYLKAFELQLCLDNLLRKRSSTANGLDDDEDEEEDTEDDSFGYEGEATEDDLNEVNSDLDLENSESKAATPAELILQRCQITATQIVCGLDESHSHSHLQSQSQQIASQAESLSADQPRDCLAPQKILKSADASTDDDDEGWLYTATAAAAATTLEVATTATATSSAAAAAATSIVDGLQSTAISSTTASSSLGGQLPPSDDSDKENKEALVVSTTTITAAAATTVAIAASHNSSNYDSSSACSSSNSNSNSNGRHTETSATSRVTQLQMQIHSQSQMQMQMQMEFQTNGNASDGRHVISNNNCYSSLQHQQRNNNEGEAAEDHLAKIKMGVDETTADLANGNARKSQQMNNSFYSRADICNISVWPAETVASCHLPPRSPAKSSKSQASSSNATMSASMMLASPAKGKVSHDSIKQLVLEAEHLVRDAQEAALKTPTKQKHSIIKISSTVKKREVTMPHPIKQRVEEWLEHQPSTPQLLTRSQTHELLPGCKPDDCEASGEASETDSVPHAGVGLVVSGGGAANGAGSDTSEGFTDSIATCMQTSTNSYGNSTERIGGSAEPIGQPVTPLGFGSSNQSLNVKIVKRPQTRRKSERPWSVSCLSQLTTDAAQLSTAHRIVENSPPGLASHSISESALDSLSPGPRPRAASSSGTGSNAARKADSKGSLRRRKARKKRISAASAGRKSDSGSELGGDLTQTLMKSCESMSSQQLQEFTNALLSIQKGTVIAPLSPKGEVLAGVTLLAESEAAGETQQLMLPKFRVGSFTTAGLLASETRLGALAALSNYMNEDEQQAELSTEDHHSSISETAWDNYQEKYNSENYSEGFDSDAARRLLEFGDDYRNYIDSQSDCCSSLSAANNLDSFSPPRMDSLQKHELKTLHINQDTITSSVDHARRQRALELQYERRRKTLEVRRKSCQDMDEIPIVANPQKEQQTQPQLQAQPSLSASATALMTTPKNQSTSQQQLGQRTESVGRKLEFGGMSHSAQSLLRRTSESDTSTRRRRTVTADERRRSSRNLEKCIKLIPATTSSSSGSDSEDGEQEMRSLLQQSRDRLDDTRALKIRCHLLRPEDYNEIINTCRDNIRCLEAVLRGPPGTVLSNHCAGQTKDLLAAWEDLLGWSENASAARKLQQEMSVLKNALQRLGDKPTPELLDTEPAIQIAVEALKLEQTQLASYRTNMLRLNASVHSWLTRQERRLQNALEEQEQQQESEQLKQEKPLEEKAVQSNGAVAITVTDSNGNQVEAMATGEASTSTAAWDVHSLMSAEQEFHKHLKNEVSDMYSAWDEADARINTQLEMLTNSLIAWRQLESGLSEFHLALGQDRGTLKGLEGALDKGQATPVELAQNVKLVAKLLSEKVNVSQEQLLAVQQHLDPNHIYHIAKFTASNGSLSDSGISDGGATSDGGLSERERRLGVLRRLAKQLELALAPGSEAMRSIAARMESAEAELKHLQNTCRDLIVRTAASHQQKQQQQSHQVPPKANGQVKKQAGKANGQPQSPGKRGKGARKARQAKNAGEDQHEEKLSPEQQKMVLKHIKTLASGDGGDDPSDDPSLLFNLESSEEDAEEADSAQASKRGWAWRIARAAVPMQVALFTIFCAACLMQPNCCDNLNNLSMSFTPQLRYIRGPPPI
ncbi:klarsicht protein isoform X4 [Drosophila gunungcola]|uniref:klarsicht protein isoform X4 n=1 Tax=Drosophila gunungcola TaxID=103775 RepID=UPI0022E4EA8C|nr:klarsicht protein isoform X4 [Drosophila gunungcola]